MNPALQAGLWGVLLPLAFLLAFSLGLRVGRGALKKRLWKACYTAQERTFLGVLLDREQAEDWWWR